ncbi:MAG: class I SAM-dependent methyltransferase [Novosphingobium sp.]|nr:class I SAM-dependent methyltransferase [Novosphingobium sp.]MCP5404062.1 class I SAM-dependent methyltransferase [Novosphingobium sp.]
MRKIIPLIAAMALAAPAHADHHMASGTQEATQAIDSVLAHQRRDGDRARDQYRHPAETLAFFRVKPGMTVVDYMPSGGWYTRVLVPYLGEEGRYIGLNPEISPGMSERLAAYFGGLGAKFPGMAAKWNLEGAPYEAYNANELGEDMNGTVDRVLIFREMHNLLRNGLLYSELGKLRDLLKDDGMLGIVQHRAKPWAPGAYLDGNKGYLRQQDVIGLVEAHGFDLVGTSEINANERDSADHPAGVWELPPVMRTGREDLKSIGESDRMTLLFRKRP